MNHISLNLSFFEKISLYFERKKNKKLQEFLSEHTSIERNYLDSNSLLNMLAFKILSIDESDIPLTELIQHNDESTPNFKCSKDNNGIEYILQGKYKDYSFTFTVRNKDKMWFFARFFENTFLERFVIEKTLSVSTDKELIYLHGYTFNDYLKHHEILVNIMSELKNKKQQGFN